MPEVSSRSILLKDKKNGLDFAMAGSPAGPKARRVCVSSWQHILSKRAVSYIRPCGGVGGLGRLLRGDNGFSPEQGSPRRAPPAWLSSARARDLLKTLGILDPVTPLPFPANTCSCGGGGRGRQPAVSMATVQMMLLG